MPSEADIAKRELVKLLRALAAKYGVALTVARESAEKDVHQAFRKVSLKAHPDKGGAVADFQKLSAANDAWANACKNSARPGRPAGRPEAREPGTGRGQRPTSGAPLAAVAPRETKLYRLQGVAVLFTYQGFSADLGEFLPIWQRFVSFVESKQKEWGVQHWTATAETNEDGKHHMHYMVQFWKAAERTSNLYAFEGALPNASANDLLGEGFAGKRFQASVDRGQFYAWANKKGTVVDAGDRLCRAGNCEPAWVREVGSDLQGAAKATYKYKVSADWPKKLWQEYKLTVPVYEEYMFLSRDKLAANKKNLELYQNWKRERDLDAAIEGRTKRMRENLDVYTPFGKVPEADDWLAQFSKDDMRYPVLLVHAPSRMGKSEWAVSLFQKPLYVEIGVKNMWPARMKKLDREVHDGLVLDDLRDLAFLEANQEKLQGKYNRPVELFNTPGGELAVTLDLYRLPMVFTINDDTKNLSLLQTSDFMSLRENVRVLSFSGRPGSSPPSETLPGRPGPEV